MASTISSGPVPPLSRAVASRFARNSAALVRAAAANAVLTLASAFSKASALSAARRFFGRAAPRPPTSATRALAARRYCSHVLRSGPPGPGVQREQLVLVEIGQYHAFGLREQQPLGLGQGLRQTLACHHDIVSPRNPRLTDWTTGLRNRASADLRAGDHPLHGNVGVLRSPACEPLGQHLLGLVGRRVRVDQLGDYGPSQVWTVNQRHSPRRCCLERERDRGFAQRCAVDSDHGRSATIQHE